MSQNAPRQHCPQLLQVVLQLTSCHVVCIAAAAVYSARQQLYGRLFPSKKHNSMPDRKGDDLNDRQAEITQQADEQQVLHAAATNAVVSDSATVLAAGGLTEGGCMFPCLLQSVL
jgi:hypothetical protein